MESSLFSDMKFVEPLRKLSNKIYMPYKQIGFFQDKLLSKNICSLKTNLEKRENFIKTYHSPETFKIKNFVIKINNGNTEWKEKNETNEEEEEVGKQEKEDVLPNISPDLNAEAKTNRKTNTNFHPNKNVNNDTNSPKQSGLTENNQKKKENFFNSNTTSFSNTSRINFARNEKKDIKNIQAISTKHKNLKIDHIVKNNINNININNYNNLDNKSRTTNNSTNILKNQIISGHLNKGIKNLENNTKKSEISPASKRNTLNSNFSQAKAAEGEYDAKSVATAKKDNISVMQQNKNVSVDCGNDSFNLNNNNKSKSGSPKKQLLTSSKIDFVYKKIFDKKSRLLIEKPPLDKNSNETAAVNKKKLKSKSENKSSDLKMIFGKGAQKRQYIEDKIEDIKRKIFFIKGVYDFSYPKIIVNKVKTAQDFYSAHHIEQKTKLRESMNNTSQKFLEKFEEKCKITNEEFRKSFYVEKIKRNLSVEISENENNNNAHAHDAYYDYSDNNKQLNNNDYNNNFNLNGGSGFPEIENKMIKSTSSLDFKMLRNPRLTLTQKFVSPGEIAPVKILNPISIKTIYPDLGEPSKLKVIHKSKIL